MKKINAALAAGAIVAAVMTGPAAAIPITYTDYVAMVSINYGGVAHTCTSSADPNCAFISIVAQSDTSTVTPFSVPGASGLTNSLLSAVMNVAFNNGIGNFSVALDVSNLFVSVDQTGGGAGFGSSYSPTYPMATYGLPIGAGNPFSTYDLASTFSFAQYGGFCTDYLLCQNGAPLFAADGTSFLIAYPFRPIFGMFSSVLSDAPPPAAPEPGSIALIALGLAGVVASRRRKTAATG